MAETSKRVYDVPEDELNEYQEAFNLFALFAKDKDQVSKQILLDGL